MLFRICLTIFLLPFVLLGAGLKPLDFREGANRSFRDDLPDDGKGGWTDQGSCDMRMFPSGKFESGNVNFQILSDKETGNRSCIVVGKKTGFQEKAVLPVKMEKSYPAIYLLHAGMWMKKSSSPAGVLNVTYTDGSESSHNLRYGRDLLNWIGDDNTAAKNAKKVWTIYNDSSQVSLFVSKIGLKSRKTVKSIEFQSQNGVWMIAAVSLGKSVTVTGLDGEKQSVPDDYSVPAAVLPSGWQKTGFSGKPQNVIFIIGDGMGVGAINAASYYGHGKKDQLVMSSLPVRTFCVTNSFGGNVTDSAAAGTALSGGYKTKNGMLGVNPDGKPFWSIAAEARKKGLSVALVTTDHLLGSTPSAFYTHVSSRAMKAEIAASATECGFDFLIAASDRRYFLPPRSLNGIDYIKRFEEAGYQLFNSKSDFLKAERLTKAVGTFNLLSATDELAKVSMKTVGVLAKNPSGFFIMIESGIPDQGGHANRPDKTVFGTLCADHVVKMAIEFALKDKRTLVIVTADHETGGVSAENDPADPKRVRISYQSGTHTNQKVPLFAFGPGAEQFAKELDNTEIPKILAKLLDLSLGNPK